MHNIYIYLTNKYISLSIQDFNDLIRLIFQKNDIHKFIILLDLIHKSNKIVFIKNNVHKFNKILPLFYKISLTLKNIIDFNYEEEFFTLPYLHLEPILNKNKRYPNYSLKINNENFLLFKKHNDYFLPVFNTLQILDHNKPFQNISNYEDILNNYNYNPQIYSDEYNEYYDKILNNIIPTILIYSKSITYFLFINNQLFLINKIMYTRNKLNKIINIQIKIKNIKYIFF